MALRPCERKQIIITNIGNKLYSIFESDKSYGKKEKGVGRGIQDCREQGEDFRYGVRVGVIEKVTLKMSPMMVQSIRDRGNRPHKG